MPKSAIADLGCSRRALRALLTMREWVWEGKKPIAARLLRPHPEERGRRPRVSKGEGG